MWHGRMLKLILTFFILCKRGGFGFSSHIISKLSNYFLKKERRDSKSDEPLLVCAYRIFKAWFHKEWSNPSTVQVSPLMPAAHSTQGNPCAGIFKDPRAAVSESLTLSAVTCSVSLNIWFVQLSEDHFSAADWSARDSTQQQCLLGPAIISLSGFQTGEVKSEAPIADGFRLQARASAAENQTESKTVTKIQVEGTI